MEKSIVDNPNLSDEGLAVYVALRKLINKDESVYYISLNQISYNLCGTYPIKRKVKDSIKIGIDNLINNKLITINHVVNKSGGEYIVDLSKIYFDTKDNSNNKQYFIIIYIEEVIKIMKYKSKFSLLRYFILLVGTFDLSKTINIVESVPLGYLTIDYMANLFKIPKNTLLTYNCVLQKDELIYVHRFDDFVITDSGLKSLHNFYGRYCNRNLVAQYARQYADALGSNNCNKKTNKQIGDKAKSYLMKYNSIKDRGTKYSSDETKAIYDFIVLYNAKQDKIIDSYSNDNSDYAIEQINKAIEKKKDLSVFADYDFINVLEEQEEYWGIDTYSVSNQKIESKIDYDEVDLINDMNWLDKDFDEMF